MNNIAILLPKLYVVGASSLLSLIGFALFAENIGLHAIFAGLLFGSIYWLVLILYGHYQRLQAISRSEINGPRLLIFSLMRVIFLFAAMGVCITVISDAREYYFLGLLVSGFGIMAYLAASTRKENQKAVIKIE